MKNFIPYILFTTLVAVTGCRKEEFDDQQVVEGQEAEIDLAIAGSGIWAKGQTKGYDLTAAEEKQVKSLEVLIFNSAQKLVSRTRIETPASLTNSIQTKTGTGMSIYVITNTSLIINASASPGDVLGNATTVTALKNVKITNMLSAVANDKTLVMYGVAENVTISNTGSSTISIPLNYVAAKVTVNVYKSLTTPGDDFELANWHLADLARYSYIFPRASDAVSSSVESDFVTQASTNVWNDGTIDVAGVPTPVKTATFYVFENRRGTTPNSDPKLKSGPTAPTKATKVMARGYYKSATGVTGLDITLMLGANSTNDYNVERTKEYIYNVNVRGISDIAVDTRFDNSGVGFQAEVVNPTLDAHYDFRPIQISAYAGVSLVEILDENGNLAPSNFWLKISPLNITKFVNVSGNYVRPTYNPANDMTITQTVTHANPTTMDNRMLYLYADEFLTDGATRTAQIRVTHTPNGGSAFVPALITITQRGILMAGNVGMRIMFPSGQISTSNYRIGIEAIEEATLSITPGNLANERTATMQYGFKGSQPHTLSTYTIRNGYDNTLNLTHSNLTTWVLRAPYGRTGNSTISHQFYDPIYNTYAARYCFEKNRDTDGDGVIKWSEVKWYLPSTEEQLLIYTASQAWSGTQNDRWTTNNVYNSSSVYNASINMATIFTSGVTGTIDASEPVYVRCVRRFL